MAASRSSASRGPRPRRRSASRPARGRRQGNSTARQWLGYATATGAGVLGIALASAVGAGELLAGGVLAYVAYRVTSHGVAPTRALMEGMEFGQGQPPKQAPA